MIKNGSVLKFLYLLETDNKLGTRYLRGIICLKFFFGFAFLLPAQTNNLNIYYNDFSTLSDEDISENSRYYREKFDSISQSENKNHVKVALFNLNRIERLNKNYIKAINGFNNLIEDNSFVLSKEEKIAIYLELREAYFKLYAYSEVFELNSKIEKLIEEGGQFNIWEYAIDSKLYEELRQYNKAVVALKKEIKRLHELKNRKDSLVIPSAYNNLGFYYFKAGKLDKAQENFNISLRLAEQSLVNNPGAYERLTGLVKGNIAEIHIEQKNYEAAIPLLKEDIATELSHNHEEGLESLVKSMNLLTRCYLNINQLTKARTNLNETENVLPKLTDLHYLADYYDVKAQYFEKQNKLDSSFYLVQKALKIKDSIDQLDVNSILAGNEFTHNFIEENRKIEQRKDKLRNQELTFKDRQNKVYLTFATLFLILLVISLYNGYKIRKSKKIVQNKNKEIIQKNELVRSALQEKEVLLKEVHHRVKNNLQIISSLLELQNIEINNPKIQLALKEGQNRIQSVALVHKMMYQSDNVSKVNMQNYFEDLIEKLKQSFSKTQQKIAVQIEANGIDFDITKAVPISLIVNEAVCNCFKYAFKDREDGLITITMKKNPEEFYELSIADNGVGISHKEDLRKGQSIGMDLMNGLARQLKGIMERTSNNGTQITVKFKIN